VTLTLRGGAVSLADLGVTPEEEQVYLAVLQTPQIDRPRLGALTGLGPECVAGCLERLLELCMVRAEPEAPSGVVPVSPTLAVDDLVERVQDGLLEQQRRVLRARAVAADLELALHRGQQGNSLGVERLESVAEVRKRLDEIAFYTRETVWAISPSGAKSPEAIEASRPLDLRALRREVDMRTIYHHTVTEDPPTMAYLRELARAGAQARTSRERLERLIIVDRRLAVVPIHPHDSSRGALVVEHPTLIAPFLRGFETEWERAKELETDVDPAQTGALSEQDLDILRLLAEGKKDEVIARSVNLSLRHVRRRIAAVIAELGSSSRFQAGVEAERQGLLADPRQHRRPMAG
jgi:DNA-binding CsgD family transcriptional regulator/sugar-specific transcriptional regulator TrmB